MSVWAWIGLGLLAVFLVVIAIGIAFYPEDGSF